MFYPFNNDSGPRRTYVDVDAELDSFDFEDEPALGSDDLNYALGRPCDLDFEEEE